MAYLSRQYCSKCEKEVDLINGKCVACACREVRQETAAWQALTIEEKLLDIHKRLRILEAKPQTYA